MQLWLYLHFPKLQLDTMYADKSQQPLVVVDAKRFQIIQCSDAAQKQGIKNGMGLGSASTLCPSLQVSPYDESVEQQALADIAQWLYLVTSDLALFPPQGLLLKLTDMLTLYGGLESYWNKISQHLQYLNVQFHYATGFSPFSAILLTKLGSNLVTEEKKHIEDMLRYCPVSAAELNQKQIEKLARVGIVTLNDLLKLPISEIARRFDIELVNYIGKLTGQFRHPVDFYRPPERFQSYLELLFEVENTQWLNKPLKKLLVKLEHFLSLRGQVAYELELRFHQRDNQSEAIILTSACGDYLTARWEKLSQLAMESLMLNRPVQGLTLKVLRSGEFDASSQDIFSGYTGHQTALELITTLQAKLGKTQIHKIAPTDDPRPEKSTILCHLGKTIPPQPQLAALRPSLILPTPEVLTDKVSLLHGPERIATGWWDGEAITRDYFIARSKEGRWLWVFRDRKMQWFLHGLFS